MKRFEGFGLDIENGCLWRETSEVLLTPKLFAVLRYFVDRPQKLISQDELLDAVWPETFVQPQVLRTYILELRKILGDDAANPRYIQTIPKRGYRFLPAVNESMESMRPAQSSAIAPGVVGRKAELEELERQLHAACN